MITDGHEIENRQLLDLSVPFNMRLYNDTLELGILIDQGYVPVTPQTIRRVEVDFKVPPDFEIDTIRVRRFTTYSRTINYMYVLTLKSDKTKDKPRREVEYKLNRETFSAYWEQTIGRRVQKKRANKKIKGRTFEIDAFTDRILLIAECEVETIEALKKVPKIGKDITNNKRMTNKKLAK
jgi:CYTH domain-containing protein